jgi:histidine triad (HIT) family protein
MASIFSKIISGEIPGYKIAETANCCAFLDIMPLHGGHALVVPKKEVDYLFDLPDDDYQELMLFSKKVAHAIGKAIPCKKVGVAVIGLEVPHAHIHLIPINAVSDIDFSREKLEFSPTQMEDFAAKIRLKFS